MIRATGSLVFTHSQLPENNI